MAKEPAPNKLQELSGVFRDTVEKFLNPSEHHGIKWGDVLDARQAVDDERDRLIKTGEYVPPQPKSKKD